MFKIKTRDVVPEFQELSFGSRAANVLLADLPDAEWNRVQPYLLATTVAPRTTLGRSGERIQDIFFIQRGYVSLMVEFADGFQAETGQIGSNGALGMPLLLGSPFETVASVAQTPVSALRISGETLLRELARMPTLRERLLRYADRLRKQAMQLAACNGHHGLDQRLARCLLDMLDRSRATELPITHEILGTLLCAHRPSVSVAAKRLQRAGLIRYSGGSINILDRDGLERTSCECHAIMRALDEDDPA